MYCCTFDVLLTLVESTTWIGWCRLSASFLPKPPSTQSLLVRRHRLHPRVPLKPLSTLTLSHLPSKQLPKETTAPSGWDRLSRAGQLPASWSLAFCFFFFGKAERNRHTTQPVNSHGTSWPIRPPREGLQNRARNRQHPRAHVARAWVPRESWRKTLRTKRRAFASTSVAKRGKRPLEERRSFPCSNCRQIIHELDGFGTPSSSSFHGHHHETAPVARKQLGVLPFLVYSCSSAHNAVHSSSSGRGIPDAVRTHLRVMSTAN